MNNFIVASKVYRLLYGSRAALEEVLLQVPKEYLKNLSIAEQVNSQTPLASILGVNIHSGDILVSRGGAPTSALISRGNDFPGNFSHVALVFVDPKTHIASIIEAHIELGVTVSDLKTYIEDKKFRLMVMRIRSDHPKLINDPLLPHKVAEYALNDALNRHIPYDFTMDYTDNTKLFCSEVASAAYSKFGIKLWHGISRISSYGLRSWLGAFGVRHFETQEPSDLEYDSQLKVVAEWRNIETLYKDHLDNAIIDVMLDQAQQGRKLDYNHLMLPAVRILKLYSIILNQLGKAGPVPEGMSATIALKNHWLSNKHNRIYQNLYKKSEKFKTENGYIPPYWVLIELAREALKEDG